MMFGGKSKTRSGVSGRLFRVILAVVILTAFVLAISLLVKELSSMNAQKFARLSRPILAKLNIRVSEEKLGEVAGEFAERITSTNISAISTQRDEEKPEGTRPQSKVVAEIAVMSDVHDDISSLEKALVTAKEKSIETVIILGDLTNYGDIEHLQKVKDALDKSGLKYYVLPGDHDLAQTSSLENFLKIFGNDHYLVDIAGAKFLILNNSANFTVIDSSLISWFEKESLVADFVLLSQPLYTEELSVPFNKMFMGNTKEDSTDALMLGKQEQVRSQRDSILESLEKKTNVRAVIAGDHHKSSETPDAIKKDLTHYVVGAVTDTVNELPQKILQTPRFSTLKLMEDKSFEIEEVVL
jgi:predicted phosphodiesterase